MRKYVGALIVLAGITAGCSHHSQPRLASRPPSYAPPSATVIPAQPDVALWHLRAGLNVAALTCRGRGRVPVQGPYGQLLVRHRSLLAAAYNAEQRRQGAQFDRSETRLYNRWSNQRHPEQFCRDAASVARRAAAMDSPTLAANAGNLLGELR
ncbi:MAG: hypothetical protein ACKOQM_08290 [Novosphingobium sp.]